MKRAYKTWGEVYRNATLRGNDHGYAAYLADEWEKRQKSKAGNQHPEDPPLNDKGD